MSLTPDEDGLVRLQKLLATSGVASPASCATSSSLSTYGQPIEAEIARPTVDFPHAIIPTSRTRVLMRR